MNIFNLFKKVHAYKVIMKVENKKNEVNYLWTSKVVKSNLGLKDFKLWVKKKYPKANNIVVEVLK